MEIALSNSDIAPFVKKIYVYSDLKHLTPQELLRNLPAAILYQRTPNYGHWTLLLRTPEGVEFFDPYGIVVDREFKHLEMKQPHYLAKLLLKLQKIIPIHYSPYHFQEDKKGVNTCGRWSILRSYYRNWTIDEFASAIDKITKKRHITPDELVVLATNFIR